MLLTSLILCYSLPAISAITEGRFAYYHIGDNASLLWTLNPIPSVEESVNVIHPSGSNLFIAREKLFLESQAFKCRVDFTGDTTTGNINFTLNNVTMNDAGEYSVNYDNIQFVGITLVIYAKPTTPTILAGTPVQGSDLDLVCSSESTSIPANNSLNMTYKWYINGTNLPDDTQYVQTENTLTIKNIQKSDNGTGITCTAEETITLPSDMSLAYVVKPEYGPGTILIVPLTRSYFTMVHSQLGPVACSTECYPACTYHWRHNGVVVTGNSKLMIDKAQEEQSGIYNCTATNKYGSMVSYEIIVVVLCHDEKTVSTKGEGNVTNDGPNTASVVFFVLSSLLLAVCIVFEIFIRLKVSPRKIKVNKAKKVSTNISDHYVDIDKHQEIPMAQLGSPYKRLSNVAGPTTYETLRPVLDHALPVDTSIVVVDSGEDITSINTDTEISRNADVQGNVTAQTSTSNVETDKALHTTSDLPLDEAQVFAGNQLIGNKHLQGETRNAYLTPVFAAALSPTSNLQTNKGLHKSDDLSFNETLMIKDNQLNENKTLKDDIRNTYLTPVSAVAVTSASNIQTDMALNTTNISPLRETKVNDDNQLNGNKPKVAIVDERRSNYVTPVSVAIASTNAKTTSTSKMQADNALHGAHLLHSDETQENDKHQFNENKQLVDETHSNDQRPVSTSLIDCSRL